MGEYLGSHCDACEFRSDHPEKSGYFQCWKERYDNFDDLKQSILLSTPIVKGCLA